MPDMRRKIILFISVLLYAVSPLYADVPAIMKDVKKELDGNNVTFEIIPAQAQVVIDGKQKYSVENGVLELNLPEGEHEYKISALGYLSFEGKLTSVPNESVEIKITLNKEWRGAIDLAAFPDDVEITYGRHKYGAMLELDGLPAGEHSFSFTKKGYRTVDTTFVVKSGVRNFYSVILSPIESYSKRKEKKTNRWNMLLLSQAGYNTDVSLGLMVGMMRKNGFYLKALTSLNAPKADYKCTETGMIQEGDLQHYPYYKTKTLYSQYAVSAGYLRMLGKPVGIYVGAGYGSHTVVWETIEGTKVENEDLLKSGAVAECGIILRLKKFALSCGVQSIDFSYTEIQFGLGVIF